VFWKIYAWAWFVVYFAYARPSGGVYSWVSVVVSVLGCLGVIGYAYQRRVLPRLFWQCVALMLIGSNIYDHFSSEPEGLLVTAATFALLAPAYYAILAYAFGNPCERRMGRADQVDAPNADDAAASSV